MSKSHGDGRPEGLEGIFNVDETSCSLAKTGFFGLVTTAWATNGWFSRVLHGVAS